MRRKQLLTFAVAAACCALLGAGCSEESATGPDTIVGGRLVVVESDFQSGYLESVAVEGDTMGALGLELFKDATVRAYGGFAYVLEKFGADNVMKIDPAKAGVAAVVYQEQVGDNWNPSDIDFVSETKAYVSNQNEPKITIWNPTTGEATGHIDISPYTFNPDSNTSPYANQMVLVGTNLFVQLQCRDGWNTGAPTLVITIDTQTDSVVAADTMRCQYGNGYDMVHVGGALYLSNPGSSFSTGDGAIERIDLSTKAVMTVITEENLGGSPNQIVHKDGTRFYVQVYVGWQDVKVVEIEATTGAIVATLPGITDAFGGICYDQPSGKLYVGERGTGVSGVLVFENNTLSAGPLSSDNSLPPASLVVVR
jgi:hypothetical protein